MRRIEPEIIVNAAAYTAVDNAEIDRELAMQVNCVAAEVLAEEAKQQDALLIHYSTDYVFDGAKRSAYAEEDTPNPLSHYARTKLDGERAIAARACRHLILRTSWVYGARAANFYQVILRKANAGEPMHMVDDQTSVPTPATFVAEHTVALLQAGAQGLLHLVPSGHATRFDFACAVVRACRSISHVERAAAADFPSAAARPAYSVLDNRKLAMVLGRRIPHWRELLATHLRLGIDR